MKTLFSLGKSGASVLVLSGCLLSFVACIAVISLILYTEGHKESYQLMLLLQLLCSNLGLCVSMVVYFIIHNSNEANQELSCAIYIPFPVFFMLCSYGFTALMALRFRHSHSGDLSKARTVPHWIVWVIALILMLPTIIENVFFYPGVSSFQNNTQGCTFDHVGLAGVVIDLVTAQCPLLLIIPLNIGLYLLGVKSLTNAPQSVVSRRLRLAGGYLFVQIIVWIPNISYNLMSILNRTNESYDVLFTVAVCFSALQGFLNVCVYIISDPKLKIWLEDSFQSWMVVFRSRWLGHDDDLERNDSYWLEHSDSFSGHLPAEVKGSSSSVSMNGSNADVVVVNPLSLNDSKGAKKKEQNLDEERFVRFGETSTAIIPGYSYRSTGDFSDFGDNERNSSIEHFNNL